MIIYISNESEVNKCTLKCSQIIVEFPLVFEAVPDLIMEWKTKVRIVRTRDEQAQCVYYALCVKLYPHIYLPPVLIAPLVLLPVEVLRYGAAFTVVVSSEAASEEGIDRPVPDKMYNVDATTVGAS